MTASAPHSRLERAIPHVRSLAATLLSAESEKDGPLRIALASAEPDQGSEVLSHAMALHISRGLGRKSVLIEPQPPPPAGPGFSEYLAGTAKFEDCILLGIDGGPSILPFGRTRRSDEISISFSRLNRLLERLSGIAEVLVFHVPGVNVAPELILLLQKMDAVVLVAARDRADKDQLAHARDHMQKARVRLVGAVLTDEKQSLWQRFARHFRFRGSGPHGYL